MPYAHIKVESDGPVASLIFNRPQVLNAFNNEAMDECRAALQSFAEDDAIRAVLVRGEGGAFSAGFDMKAAAERDMSTVDHVRRQMERQFDFIMAFWDCPKPTVALVHGFCMAGAFEVALACDITIAAQDAVFGEPELRFGAGIVVMLLPWLAGPKRAKQLLLTGDDTLPAQRAEAMGLVNEVVPTGEELARALAIAGDLAMMDAMALRETKRAINRSYEIMGMGEALAAALDIDLLIEGEGTADKRQFMDILRRDGLRAALAWRDARFSAKPS